MALATGAVQDGCVNNTGKSTIADRVWSTEDLAEKVEAGMPKLTRRGPYARRKIAE